MSTAPLDSVLYPPLSQSQCQAPSKPRHHKFNFGKRSRFPFLLIAPFLILFCVFSVYPLARSFTLSFYKSAGPQRSVFIGAENYLFLLRDWLFWRAVINTIGYTIAFLAIYIPVALGLALMLNSNQIRHRGAFRCAFFLSHLVGNVAAAILFAALLSPRNGLINRVIAAALPSVGSELNWRADPRLAMPAIVLASVWLSVGYGVIYLLASLQRIEPQLYEAVRVDGANRFQKFREITFPGIRPALLFVLLVGMIGSLEMFELPYVFFNGPGPGFAGLTIVMYLYQQGFEAGNIGFAAAIGWVLTLMIFLVSLAQLRAGGIFDDLEP